MDVIKQLKLAKGRGRGSPRGRGGARGGRGRGRGRGNNNTSISRAVEVIDEDDGDDICNMALANVELENNSLMMSFEELNNAEALDGFDETSAGGIWIYPINRAIRDYQYDIVKTALFHNTLVSLPTGLGKTFISAVVMYNFSRWYPSGIVVFMAPTRPLVAQQLDACHNTVGIDKSRTVELTGHIPAKKREHLWKSKTVFFLTPQVMLSDIERNFFQIENVRCVVVDEAHKALGNHAYVQVISKLIEKNRLFRVLALTATPGSDSAAVQQVFKNLIISRVELRSEHSPDILPYTHEKKKEVHVVRLVGYVKEVYDKIIEIFQEYSGKLMKANALVGRSGSAYSKFQLLKARETFRENLGKRLPNYQKSYIEIDFNICISVAHAIEILNSHGLRTFYIYLLGKRLSSPAVCDEFSCVLDAKKGSPAVSSALRKNDALNQLVQELQAKLNISIANSTFDLDISTSALYTTVNKSPNTSARLDRSFGKNDDVDYTLSHPKLIILKDIVEKHFLEYKSRNDTTRAIIFSQYRDSVQEIGNMLNSLRPMVKPMIFIGKANTGTLGAGLKQKDQIHIVEQFREGGFNVLVATSVGEEGLDIGEVDLIVCFDASRSPTRLIQRMGRTGRQRDGRTVFLLTSGREEKSYATSLNQHSNISKTITDPNQLEPFLYKKSPRMVPLGVDLSCYKMEINLPSEQQHQPKPVVIDIDDDGNHGSKSKTILKPVPGKSKKKNATSKGKATTAKVPSILTLFERLKSSQEQEPPVKKRKTDEEPCPQEVPVQTREHIPEVRAPLYQDNDAYFVEEDIHMFAVEPQDALSGSSVISKIFDMEPKETFEWTPCTTFYKKHMPSTEAVSSGLTSSDLDDILLDDKELLDIERNIQARKSFSYVNTDFCECGNTVEADDWSSIDKYGSSPVVKGEDSKSTSTTSFSESIMQRSLHNHSDSSTDFSELVGNNSRVTNSSTTDFSEPVAPQIAYNNKNVPILNDSPKPVCIKNKSNETSSMEYSGHTSKTSQIFKFKRKEPDTHSTVYQNQSQSKTLNQAPSPVSLVKPKPSTSLTLSKSPLAVSNLKHGCQSQSPLIAKADKSPLKQNHSKTSPKTSWKKSSISSNMCNYPKQSCSPPSIFNRKSSATRPNTSYKQNLADSPRIPITPEKENFADEDSENDFSIFPASPDADVSSNPFVEELKKLKAKATVSSEAEKNSPIVSEVVNDPWDAIDDDAFDAFNSFNVHDNSVEVVDLDVSDVDDSNFVVHETEPLMPPNSVVRDTLSSNHSQLGSPFSSKRHEDDLTDTFSEEFSSARRRFKFKKPPTKPLIESPSSISGEPNSNSSANSSKSNWDAVVEPEPNEELNATLEDYLGGAEHNITIDTSFEADATSSGRSRSSSPSPPPKELNTIIKSKFKLQRQRSNPFIESQAVISDDESVGTSDSQVHHDDNAELDDSFVDHDNDDEVTSSQQAMYVKSVRDIIPARFGRVERPLSPKHYGTTMDTSEEGYDHDDSFCQEDDEVDYLEVGCFTQAMNLAKVELASGSSNGTRYQTRRAKKVEGSSSGKSSSGKGTSQPKKRRRIIAMYTSSEGE